MELTKEQLQEARRILAKQGGDANLKKYGRKHFVDMINKRWKKKKAKKVAH